MPVSNKGFTELFGEAKNGLDHLQANLASILPAFPGMPAAKYFDLAIGIDFHPTIIPACPVFPVPHIGMVFDIMGAIMNAIASALPDPPPPPPAAANGQPAPQPVTVLSVANAVVNALKPSVKVHGQWVANAGTGIQHLPGIIVHLVPLVAPMASSEMWMGSSTVLADGGPFSTQFHPALSCNIVGFPSLFRKNKPPKPKMALMAPTSILLCITSSGNPVLVGGPPTIDLFQLAFKMGLKGLGKAFRGVGNKFQKLIDDIAPKKPKLGSLLQGVKCKSFGEPVDAATGRVYVNNTDFELPGPIPLIWNRIYYSDAEVPGPMGSNWHHSYNMGLYDMNNGMLTLRLQDGRETVLPAVQKGELFYQRKEQLFIQKDDAGYFITDASKLIYRFAGEMNGEGYAMLSSITDPQGFSINFRYNRKGQLKQIIDSSERSIEVENDEMGRILRLYTFANGKEINFIRYTYDAQDNLVKVMDVIDAEKHFYYDGHLMVKLTNQSGMSFYWEYEREGDEAKCIHTWGDGGVLEYWTQYEEGKTITSNSLGHTTEYYYDSQKLIHKIVDANGGITRQVYNEFQELVVSIDPEGGTVQYHYNQFGKLSRQVDENEEATTYNYDERLNLTALTSAGGMRLTWKYDEQNRIIERRLATGNTISCVYEGLYLKKIRDHKNRIFEFNYDNQHNLVSIHHPNALEQTWQYDDLGNLLSVTDVRGNTTRYQYNDAGLVTWIKESDGNQHYFEYDASRNLIKAEDDTREVIFDYGPLGILLSRKQDNSNVHFSYDTELQLRTISNEGGEVYKYGLDALGNVVSEWGFDGTNRRYLRDSNSRVIKILRPAEKWTSYDYDGVGNIVKEEHSDGSMSAYRYNKDGLIIEAFNEDTHIKLQRDNAGRIVKELQGDYEVTKKYDRDGNCVHTGSNLGASIAMQYDEYDMLKEMKAEDREEGKSWQAQFFRDNTGLELHRQLTGGVSVQVERDQQGRVVKRTIGARNVEESRTRYEWGKGHKLKKIVNELNRAQTDFKYDPFDNLISATYNDKGHSETIYRVPDKIGNLYKSKDRGDRRYAKGGRLLEDETYCYHYDAEGNLVFREFKVNENRRAADQTAYAESRKITLKRSATGWAYEWSGNGMLQKVINPGGAEVTFIYDPLGRRIVKQYQGRVTRWVWDGNTPLHEWSYMGVFPPQSRIENDGGIKEEKEPVDDVITWVFEEGGLVPCAKLEAGKKYSIVTDYLGTPTHGYDEDGNLVWERELDCYGAVRKLNGQKNFCNYLYQGQYVDEETGLAYNRFRYYDNGTGNYISQDPIRVKGGLKMYGYVRDVNIFIDAFALSELVYQLLNDKGEVVYYGITERTALQRGQEHINDGKPFSRMEVLAENLNHDQARTMEANLIRKRLRDRIASYDPLDSIEEKLRKSGLLNKNRGRDIDVPGRKYVGDIPKLAEPRNVEGLKFKGHH